MIKFSQYIEEGALADKAKKSGISVDTLRKVYNRGVAAWRTGHRPGTTPQQWGYARVNSFITKGKGTWGKADKDLAAKVQKEEMKLTENFDQLYSDRERQEKIVKDLKDKLDNIVK